MVIRYLVFNVKRKPFNNIHVRRAIAYLMPRATIAKRVYHNTVSPLYSMVPKGLPGQYDAFKTAYGASPNLAKAKAEMKGMKKPLPITLWYTPSHYGAASADEYVEIQRALNASRLFKVTLKTAEWATYAGNLGKVYGGFQLGWFPDYPDADDYTVSFYQTGSFFTNGYSSKHDEQAASPRSGRQRPTRLAMGPQGDPGARSEGSADDPVLAGKHGGREPQEHEGHRLDARRRVLHAVLADLEAVSPNDTGGASNSRAPLLQH